MASPIPSTARSSSTLVKPPLDVRQSMMARAVTGPTPGSSSSCSWVAVLMLTRRRGRSHDRCRRGGHPGRRRHPHHDLLAVDEQPGLVEGAEVDTPLRPARRLDRVDHARPGREPTIPGSRTAPTTSTTTVVAGAPMAASPGWRRLVCPRRGGRRSLEAGHRRAARGRGRDRLRRSNRSGWSTRPPARGPRQPPTPRSSAGLG